MLVRLSSSGGRPHERVQLGDDFVATRHRRLDCSPAQEWKNYLKGLMLITTQAIWAARSYKKYFNQINARALL
jgi:hypothetical protein